MPTQVSRSSGAGAPNFPGGFTVLMAVYWGDEPRLFQMAVDSVYANTLPPDDFLVVVDGPVPDALRQVVLRYQAERSLRAVWLPENVGLARALNAGLLQVRTEWVARADADDFNLPDRFEKQARAIRDRAGELDLLGGAILEVDRAGAPMAVRDAPLTAEQIASRLPRRSPFNHMTVAYRTASVRDAGGYPDIHLKEDYGLWATLLSRGARCLNLADILVHATADRDLYRRRGGLKYARAEWNLQLHFLRLRSTGLAPAIVYGGLRAAVACLPAGLRGWIYQAALRRKASGTGS